MASRSLYSLVLLAGFACASPLSFWEPKVAPLHVPPVGAHSLRNNSYIVAFRNNVRPSTFDAHLNFVKSAGILSPLNELDSGIEITNVYDSDIAKGYAGKFSPDVLDMIRRRPEVDYVEQDQAVYLADMQQEPPWGLARISHRGKYMPPADEHYVYVKDSGKGVMVYVIDSGVFIEHEEFEGRAKHGMTFKGKPDTDAGGHGTHVAGVVASAAYGVSKKAEITSLKVFDEDGKSENAAIIAAVVWAVEDARKLESRPGHKGAVINMSLVTGRSKVVEDAVNNAVKAGIVVVVAAGNANVDACRNSPGSAELTITVGATNSNDERANYSNWGKCVNILAPGNKIKSTSDVGPTEFEFQSGTSQAAPHVAGVVANFLSIYPHPSFNPASTAESTFAAPANARESTLLAAYSAAYGIIPEYLSNILPAPSSFIITEKKAAQTAAPLTPERIRRALMEIATPGAIVPSTLPEGTPNLLLYTNMTHPHLRDNFGETDFWDFF